MKPPLLIIILLLLFGCYPKINKHFNRNRYVLNCEKHITNDSLKLYLNSPADIIYPKNRKEIRKRIKNHNFKINGEIVVYGYTTEPPYEYFITFSKKEKQPKINSKNTITLDTTIKNNSIRAIGYSKNNYKTLKSDLKNIFRSIDINKKYKEQIISISDVTKKHFESNRFLNALEEINNFPVNSKKDKWYKLQMQLTFSSFLGEQNHIYKKYLTEFESKIKSKKKITNIISKNIKSSVIETIIEKAKKHKIVMINENHFYPSHRLLVIDLLNKLKSIGYNYIALEALDKNQDSVLNQTNSFPTLKSGFYTSEQNFSNLIRKAKKLGFKFICYENFNKNKSREEEQAKNLYDKTIKIDKKAKVVVLAGVDHILENEVNNKKWLASILKEQYNIDPLTISQSHLNQYRKLSNNTYSLIESSHFKNKKLNSVDFHVLNNNLIKIKKSNLIYKNKFSKEVQICIFYKNECLKKYDYLKNVPYFTTTIKADKTLHLPILESSLIYIFDENSKKLDFKSITVANPV